MDRTRPPQPVRSTLCALVLLVSCGGKAVSAEREEPRFGGSTAPGGDNGIVSPGGDNGIVSPGGDNGTVSLIPPEETCAENPLLAGCPLPAAAGRSDDLSLPYVVRMEALLDENCGSCHGSEARRNCNGICEGMMYIDDMPALLENGKLLPCDWRGSPLAQRLRNSSMPPPATGLPPMSNGDQQELEVFVENMCTDLLYPGNFGLLAAQELLRESCGSCHGATPVDAGSAPGGLSAVDDVAAQIESGFLIPCRSDASPIVLAMRNGNMPPMGSGVQRPSRAQINRLANFIDRPCAR